MTTLALNLPFKYYMHVFVCVYLHAFFKMRAGGAIVYGQLKQEVRNRQTDM